MCGVSFLFLIECLLVLMHKVDLTLSLIANFSYEKDTIQKFNSICISF